MLRALLRLPWSTRADPPTEAARPLDVEAVHASHADHVWASLQRLGVREPDLADLAQEVFVVVHARLPTFDSRLPLAPWLFGICRRVAAAHRRRSYVRREEPWEDLPERSAEAGPDPEQSAETREAREALAALLDELPPDKRAVFVMFEIDELPCEVIAADLGVPIGTVHSRLHAARKAFERALARRRARLDKDLGRPPRPESGSPRPGDRARTENEP